MTADGSYVVVSGIPGSGKTTVARGIAPLLGRALLDKDDFLDTLFEERGIGDDAWRAALSREADARFLAAARATPGAVLVSWWRHPHATSESGTPLDWLAAASAPLLELHCRCDAAIAAARFLARSRHAGHRDHARTQDRLIAELTAHAALGPLAPGLGCVEIETSAAVDPHGLAERVRAALTPPA